MGFRALTFVVSFALLAFRGEGLCPIQCKCKWKDNGEVVLCINKGLSVLPDSIDAETHILNFSGNPLKKIRDRYFEERGLTNLKELYLSNCSIRSVRRHAFMELKALTILDLSHNDLLEVPGEAFAFTPSLKILKLNYNPLRRIRSSDFSMAVHLSEIQISHSKINYIHPDAFAMTRALRFVDLSNNELKWMNRIAAEGILDNPDRRVVLDNNPWQCDCEIKPLYKVISRNKRFHLECQTPPQMSGLTVDSIQIQNLICPPEIIAGNNLEKIQMDQNGNIAFRCEAEGDPPPDFFWYLGLFGNEPIKNNTKMNFNESDVIILADKNGTSFSSSSLKISNMKQSNEGIHFRCLAVNSGGKAEKKFLMQITSGGSAYICHKPLINLGTLIMVMYIYLKINI